MVSPDRQAWHCFGACGEGGDIFKFLMKYENLEFYEALKVLAEKAGIELKRVSPSEYKQFDILFEINAIAKDFFKKELEKTSDALSYIKERRLNQATIDEFELGFAPAGFDRLTLDLIKLGFNVKDIERAGLAFKSERGRYIDRFRARLMFPIYNHFGKVIGFSGRILPQAQTNAGNAENDADRISRESALSKYVNSPETPIFNKSRVFYGLHKSKNHIKESGEAVLVEGQMDFLMLYQDGVRNTVATSGTALTLDHLRVIRRLTDKLILCFDNDEAGLKAAERSIDLAGANDMSVKLLILKDYKDPADAARDKPGLMASLVKSAIPAMEFYFERYLGESTKLKAQNPKFEIGSFKDNLRVVLSKIKNLASPIEKSYWLKELSERVRIKEEALTEEMEQMKNEKSASRKTEIQNLKSQTSISRRALIAERLLSLVFARDNLRGQIQDSLEYLPEDYSFILNNLSELSAEERRESMEKSGSERIKATINIISLRASFELEILGEEKIEEEFRALLREVQYEYLKERRIKLSHSIKELEGSGEGLEIPAILKEFDEVSRMMENKRQMTQ